ncbi:MAG: hypothetical protein IJZ60_04750 [Bacteroides sp.]|nr:hypothetical protein [Bacteroides sp.]
MGYIKFVIKHRVSDSDGKSVKASICRIESDRAGASQLDTNLIFHALSAKGGRKEMADSVFPFILDYSTLA